MLDIELQEVFETLEIYDNIFDRMRIVDPSINRIIDYREQEISEGEECYLFFEKGKMCKSCVSIHAFHNNEIYQKTENISDMTYSVTAIPIELSSRRVVLEVLRGMGQKVAEHELMEVYNLSDIKNNLAFMDVSTGFYSKRYVFERLPVDFILGTLANHPVSCLMVEVFQAEEHSMKVLAEKLQELHLKGNSWVARLENHLLIHLPNAKPEELAHIQREVKQIPSYPLVVRTSAITLKSGQVRTVEDVIKTLKEHLN